MNMQQKKIPIFLFYFCELLYFEILFRFLGTKIIFSETWIYTVFYVGFLSLLFTVVTSIGNKKINSNFFFLFQALFFVWYCAEIIFKNSFHVYFSISTLFFADQALSFADKILEILFSFFPILIFLFLPIFCSVLLKRKINFEKKNYNTIVMYLCISFISFLIFQGFLQNSSDEQYSPKNLYFHIYNNALNKETFGALPSLFIEVRKLTFPKTEIIYQIVKDDKVDEDIPLVFDKNILDIPFAELSQKETDETLQVMHQYFFNDVGTDKNKYTGYFKDKNLILIMAESFNSIAVSETLTPTLYKLSQEGFVFENFYSPVILSTIGGEFQELTGLFPNLSMLSKVWRSGINYFPFGVGNVFQNSGYKTYAYHNHKYAFQNRDKYLKSIGLSNYLACGNGLEKRINCNLWPESDYEMVESTTRDFLNKNLFFTYYVSVSGHMSYNFTKNDMAIKNQDAVSNLPYSKDIKAYLASQMELDKALEKLLQDLQDSGRLDDTVIALVGDHYPYDISLDHINEIANPKRDDTIEINRSNLILWNSKMTPVKVEKVGGNMDLLPTLLNLFDIPYDSRLIMGKDLLSSSEGLVIFADSSWVSDSGTYLASSKQFFPRGEMVSDDYIRKMNQIVSNRINMSKLILEKDYYKKVLGES